MNSEDGGALHSALFGPDFPRSSTPYFVLWPRVSSLLVTTFYLICLSLLNLSALPTLHTLPVLSILSIPVCPVCSRSHLSNHYEEKGLRASSGDNHDNSRPWGGKGLGQGPTPGISREKEEKKLVVLPELGCLATYISYVSRVSHMSMLGVVSTPS